jgi:segregation and condensation protein A
MDYRVELDVYNGPLDLLLYLIKRDELDIYDIPIARITDGYMAYVRQLKELHDKHGLDINVAGEFLVMAATLMEIKSAMLLPKPPLDPGSQTGVAELTDPRAELVKQLLEYKRFKEAAGMLEARRQEKDQRFPRHPVWKELAADEPPPVDLDEVQVWDLLSAFTRLLSEIGTRPKNIHEVVYDDTPIDLHAADIEDLLRRQGKLTLRGLIIGRRNRSEMIGLFLALLELVRQRKILVQQDGLGGDVEIESAPEEHRQAQPPAV